MVDSLTPAQRSARMARIRGKDTAPEVTLRRGLHKLGFRYRLHNQLLPGRPDIVLPFYKTVVLVHGCFWHRHQGCKVANTPKSNVEFWQAKFTRNVERDLATSQRLMELGWQVIVVWECELNTPTKAQPTIERVAALLRSSVPTSSPAASTAV